MQFHAESLTSTLLLPSWANIAEKSFGNSHYVPSLQSILKLDSASSAKMLDYLGVRHGGDSLRSEKKFVVEKKGT